jgi:hypothetical protein
MSSELAQEARQRGKPKGRARVRRRIPAHPNPSRGNADMPSLDEDDDEGSGVIGPGDEPICASPARSG